MPELQTAITETDRDTLERVRVLQGLDTIEQAAEWLLKTRLRRGGVIGVRGQGRRFHADPGTKR